MICGNPWRGSEELRHAPRDGSPWTLPRLWTRKRPRAHEALGRPNGRPPTAPTGSRSSHKGLPESPGNGFSPRAGRLERARPPLPGPQDAEAFLGQIWPSERFATSILGLWRLVVGVWRRPRDLWAQAVPRPQSRQPPSGQVHRQGSGKVPTPRSRTRSDQGASYPLDVSRTSGRHPRRVPVTGV